MATGHTVLLLGATGRTGGRALEQLLARGVGVRALVRAGGRLPPGAMGNPALEVVEASVLSLSDAELQGHVRGCDAVVSCLGHVPSVRGIFGPPRDLVTAATRRLCRSIEALAPAAPVRFVLMSSVSVHRRGTPDGRRGPLERMLLWVLGGVIPPVRDNQRAADFLREEIGPGDSSVEWVVVRPDTLRDGDVSAYAVNEGLVDGLFAPGSTNMANVAHVMCELVTNPATWAHWKGKLPVITNAEPER